MGEAAYQKKQQRIVAQLHRINQAGIPIQIKKRTSNLFRDRQEADMPRLDFTGLNQVLNIDQKAMTAEVEAATTYKDLVDATLPLGVMPAVVPQFTTITVGGAVSGGACESTAFRYGPAHETVLEMTVLLSSGEVVTATPTNEHRDLFFALPNSFGSLGYILKLKILLVPVKPYVKLRHLHFNNTEQYFETLQTIWQTNSYEDEPVDFFDGMVLGPDSLHITLGGFVDSAPYTSDYTYMKIYYKSIASRDEDYLTVHDFIWRWEADWTWGSKAFGMQRPVLRLLLGKWMLNSASYWRLVNLGRRVRRGKPAVATGRETLIQDTETPLEKSREFLEFFMREFDLRPIWVCPMKSFAGKPFTFVPMNPAKKYINLGLWGSATSSPSNDPHHFNRLLEKSVLKFGGTKALYSEVYYTPKEFWSIYDKKRFDELRAKYDPDGRLKDLYEKVH